MGREQFSGPVDIRWVEDHPRDMVLLKDLVFFDDAGRKWIALKYARINGASIPPILWPIIGSPYVGLYRRASVLHDYYYTTHLRPRDEVDLMFLDAMIADGVDEHLAAIMYNAVRDFGGASW